uniref:Uncharacterized protein n=1 Tax=Sus scrofa TaxID=9823 RepID=A0A8D0QFR3_PIG
MPTALYFFFSTSCSAASLALFACMPKSQALAQVTRRLAKALKFFSSMMTLAFSLLYTFHMGMTGPVSWVANLNSSAQVSPFVGAEGFLGKRMGPERYSLRHHTLACRDSVHLFRCQGSTKIPMVRAAFLWIPATLSSSRLKPLPACTFVWYLTVGHLTTGQWPDTGHGSMQPALSCWALVPVDLAHRLVEPRGHALLPVLVEVGLQDHAIPAGRHGCGQRASSEGPWQGKGRLFLPFVKKTFGLKQVGKKLIKREFFRGTAERNPTRNHVNLRVQSLASLSGLRILRCRELWCRSKMRLGSGVAVALA